LNPDYAEMLSALFAENVEFLIVGAVAVAAHGIPRATGDIDIWVNPDPANAERVWGALVRFGAPLAHTSPADFASPNVIFQLGVPPRRIDLITTIDGVDWNEAWATRATVEVDNIELPLLSCELLLRNKRAAGRPQDLADAVRLERHLSKRQPKR
jgi:hypothetical protein